MPYLNYNTSSNNIKQLKFLTDIPLFTDKPSQPISAWAVNNGLNMLKAIRSYSLLHACGIRVALVFLSYNCNKGKKTDYNNVAIYSSCHITFTDMCLY